MASTELLNHGISLGAAGGLALTALWMALTPGPNMVYLVSRSISQGRLAGLMSLAGTGVGFVLYLAMANLGLTAIFIAAPWLFIGLKAAGVAYLLWLAWNAFRPNGVGVFEARELASDPPFTLFRMGLLTNLANPKAAVMYLTLIPQFIDPAGGSVIAQGFILGGIQIAVSLGVNGLIVIAAGSIAGFLSTRPQWLSLQRKTTGVMLGLVAVLLAWEVPHGAGMSR